MIAIFCWNPFIKEWELWKEYCYKGNPCMAGPESIHRMCLKNPMYSYLAW